MAAYNKFNAFVEALALKKMNLGTDTLKVMLTNTAPVAANSVYADISAGDLATANGYTNGGATVTTTSCVQTSGVLKLILADVVVTASGAVGPFRYAVLLDFTATNKDLIGWWDYGSSISLANGETFTVDFDSGTGVLTVT